MYDALTLALNALAGGCLVVASAVLSETFTPKRFAGLFGAAPAVAIAGLTLVLLDKGAHTAHQNAAGMIAGSAGMVAYAAVAVALLRRMRASRAAVAGLGAWGLVTALASLPVFL